MKRKLFFIIFICWSGIIFSQTLPELEERKETLYGRIIAEQERLDSLISELEKETGRIAIEKSKKNPDQKDIDRLNSASVIISNKIEEKQKLMDALNKEVSAIDGKLLIKYQEIIDEYLNRKEKNNLSKAESDSLDDEIIELTARKINSAPVLSRLSIEPDKLLTISPEDPEKGEIIKEYYSAALTEVKRLRSEISEQLKEIDKMENLKEESEELLQENGFENIPLTSSNVVASSAPAADFYAGEGKMRSNIISLQNTISRLSISAIDKGNSAKYLKNNMLDESDEEYKALLSNAETLLKEYESILQKRFSSF